MKKLLAILCAVMLVLTCSISVFAEGETGSITITNAVEGKTYSVYKIFNLETNGSAYYYTINDDWNAYFANEGAGLITVDASGAVTVADKAAAAALAKALMTYIESKNEDNDPSNNIVATATNTTGSFTGLEFGYYLVDSALGAVCGLTTTAPNVTIEDKNTKTNVDKVIVEEDNSETKANTAKIGDTVSFKSTITVGNGLETLTWYDTMTDGLTYNQDLAIEGLTADNQYTIETNKDGYDIVVTFTEAYLESLGENAKIVITYSAVLNENAAIAGDGNLNTVNITYGDNNKYEGTPVTTVTKTYAFDLVKTDSSFKLLADAKFRLYSDAACTIEVPVVANGGNAYRVAVGETGVDIVSNATNYLTISGLENGTYYLKEIDHPTGYNPLTEAKEIVINDANISTKMDGSVWEAEDGGVQITNNSGNVLPETGGMGTTLFIAIGSIVVLITGVVLVARKRMSKYVA